MPRLRIAYMDDYEPSRKLFGKLFRRFQPVTLSDEDDWRRILAGHFQAIFLNIKMAHCSGFDVVHYLRQEVGYTGPIYAITGFLSEQLTTKELATFDALFTKPMVSHTAEIDTILDKLGDPVFRPLDP